MELSPKRPVCPTRDNQSEAFPRKSKSIFESVLDDIHHELFCIFLFGHPRGLK